MARLRAGTVSTHRHGDSALPSGGTYDGRRHASGHRGAIQAGVKATGPFAGEVHLDLRSTIMAIHHVSAALTTGLVALVIATAPPAACALSTGRDTCSVLLRSLPTNDENRVGDPRLADYPAGASGTSNGSLTAAQRGEPVGGGGTSGGSLSPFALATAD
jgi:hypothetical protein